MVLAGLDRVWFSRQGTVLRRAAEEALSVLSPQWCVGCRAPGEDLCEECGDDLRLLTTRPFRSEAAAEALPLLGEPGELQVMPVVAAGRYETLLADVVLAFKDHERVGLRRRLAPALGRAVHAAAELLPAAEGSPGRGLLIWPPASRSALMRRGRHPLQELIAAADLPSGITPVQDLLLHRRPGPAELLRGSHGQKGRGASARRRAAAQQYALAPGAHEVLEGNEVLLVDDVLTTGATLGALYDLLVSAGARVHAAAVLAATARPAAEDEFAAQSAMGS